MNTLQRLDAELAFTPATTGPSSNEEKNNANHLQPIAPLRPKKRDSRPASGWKRGSKGAVSLLAPRSNYNTALLMGCSGWPSWNTKDQHALHYAYTLPPITTAAVLVALWANTDLEIKRLQPYVDLVHGNSPPHRSLLLDYTRTSNFLVWSDAVSNKHCYAVTIASLMVLVSLPLQPLVAALLVVRDTWVQEPDVTLKSHQSIGLDNDTHYRDPTSFLTAASYVSASVLYNLADPPFVKGKYTVARFQLPTNLVTNGTAFANTTAIKSETDCQPAEVLIRQHATLSSFLNSVQLYFGFSIIMASATFCYPSIALWDVNVSIDLASGNVTDVKEIRPFTSQSNFLSYSRNLTGAPLNGPALNGTYLNFTQDNEFINGRRNATQLQLPVAVYQAGQLSEGGTTMYISLVARTVYFLDVEEPLIIQLKTFRKHVWLSDIAVHLLSASMLLLALFGTVVHLFHRSDRRDLRLRHKLGTIASAVSIGARTGMGDLLAGVHDSKDISQALKGKKFRINPNTMKIIMESEEGYEYAVSPGNRRGSIFAALQSQRQPDHRF
ncbi:hypothetical protein BDZ94DRAFT_1311303 [Collybia nuda]|uniref:Uncharacterized protein n=1 Tax=Collybia nuda TaxID=64659 RepID=A0A9P5Y1K5_9AGAR|nr:hypothetical protein BDZ94DRAFT_1311303 [Collybia nuda]